MCPLCLSALGLALAGALSAGGFVAFTGRRRSRSSTADEEKVA